MNNARLRILMLIPHLGVGGAQGAFLRLARFLSRRASVTVALMQGDTTDASDLPVVLLNDKGGGGRAGRWWRMLRRLRLLKQDHDVTISFLSGVNLLNAMTGSPKRSIVSERGSKRHDIGMTPIQRFIWTRVLDPLTYWRAGRVVAASDGLAHELVTSNPWAASRVTAIEGTIEAQALLDAAELPIEADLEPLAQHETIVAFGRLHIQKGYDFLLSVFAELRADRPLARLLLIGDGPEAECLRSGVRDLGLSFSTTGTDADVIFLGPRTNPLRYLRLCRAFVMPSRYEGLPNALIEAIAAGVPVLASDCPWGPRSVLSGGTLVEGQQLPELPLALSKGLLMPLPEAVGSQDAWVRELKALLEAPLPQRKPHAERLAAVEEYDIERTGPVWLELAETMARGA